MDLFSGYASINVQFYDRDSPSGSWLGNSLNEESQRCCRKESYSYRIKIDQNEYQGLSYFKELSRLCRIVDGDMKDCEKVGAVRNLRGNARVLI